MKAISIKSPYAQLIQLGYKKLEVRTKPTKHRGDVLICVSKSSVYLWQVYNSQLINKIVPVIDLYNNPGMSICIATITDCRLMRKQDEAEAFVEFDKTKYVYVLENIRMISPFKVKGQLGLFNVDIK